VVIFNYLFFRLYFFCGARMFEILQNTLLAPNLHRLTVHAPRIAKARQPGQFVMVRADIGDERIPLTIGDADAAGGTITLYIQAIGAGTRKIVSVPAGGVLRDVAGPLGRPTHLRKWGNPRPHPTLVGKWPTQLSTSTPCQYINSVGTNNTIGQKERN
jgi:NAD(P)H-flavin reductase